MTHVRHELGDPTERPGHKGHHVTAITCEVTCSCGDRFQTDALAAESPQPIGEGEKPARIEERVARLERLISQWRVIGVERGGLGTPVVHRCPPPGWGITPCCGRTPFELGGTDQLTEDEELVTCK